MTKAGYDPNEMAEMFRTLDRVSGGSSRSPEWLSTHPNPENRVQKTLERISAWGKPTTGLTTHREEFVRRLDGLVFGDDPRNGFFRQTTYFHPTLKFRFDFPSAWKTQNQAEQVIGVSPQDDAIIVVSVAPNVRTPGQALQQFLSQQGVQAITSNSNGVNGLAAATGQFVVQAQSATLSGYVSFVQLDGAIFRVLAYSDQANARTYDTPFRAALGTFQRLTDPTALNVKPARVRIVRLQSAMTLTQFQQQFPSSITMDQLVLINGVQNASVTLPAGHLVKRVFVE